MGNQAFRRFWLGIGLRYWPWPAMLIGLWWLQSAWAAALIYHGGIILGLALRPSAFGKLFRGWNSIWAGLSLAAAVVIFFAVWFSAPLVTADPYAVPRAFQLTGLSSTGVFIAFALYSSLVNPILEELCWRELVHPAGGDLNRPHLRDFEFMAYHLFAVHFLFPGRLEMLAAAAVTLVSASWIWRMLRERLGGLAIPVLSHALADFAILCGAFLVAPKFG